MTRDVVLLHGLWMPRLVMALLAARLARTGLRCHLFAYTGRAHALDVHVERLRRYARECAPEGAHFVGHSLGGRVVLRALQVEPELPLGHTVLLGTPAQGNLAGRRLSRWRWGRWLLGASVPLWAEGADGARWSRAEPLGVIAGSRPFGLGPLLARMHGENDGVVRVEETAVPGMTERIVLPVSHSGMLLSARVARQVEAFLLRGRFQA